MRETQNFPIAEKVMPLIMGIRKDVFHYNFILIKAGTGKGKTSFVLEELLAHAMGKKKRILYLVNRTALKKQIEKRVTYKAQQDPNQYNNIRKTITIETYAALERKLCECHRQCCDYKNNHIYPCNYSCKFSKSSYAYIVMDEDHYFYNDALFNTNTWLSFEWLMSPDPHVIKIGMSATPEDVHEYMRHYVKEKYKKIAEIGLIQSYPSVPGKGLFGYANPCFYFLGDYGKSLEPTDTTTMVEYQAWDTDYSYICPHVFCSDQDILGIVDKVAEKEKILIFVDSIQRGKKMDKDLKSFDSRFVDSSYRDDKNGEMFQNVNEIVMEEQFSSRILITTATLDNGINLSDISCRHVIIMTDERTSFLQMLGRKRVLPNETVHIYIHVGDVEHFKKRKGELQRLLNLYENTYNMGSWQLSNSILQEKKFDISLVQKLYFWDNHIGGSPQYGYVSTGFRLNEFSFMHACKKVNNLERIIDGLEQDPKYFIKEQLSWLGLSPDSADMVKSTEEIMEEKKAKLIQIFDEEVRQGGDFDKEGKNKFVDSISDDLRSLYSYNSESGNDKPNLKNGIKDINKVLAKVGIPYQFDNLGNKKNDNNGERKNKYIIFYKE